ncbi:MAG: helix-turn-helix domain-containing protein, partial [Candidatus Thorarchaeota archaeon]
KVRNESLEATVESLKAAPVADTALVTELRQNAKVLEAERNILENKITDTETNLHLVESQLANLRDEFSKKELECEDYRERSTKLQAEAETVKDRLEEVDELRARVRSLESGDSMRELERTRSEIERLSASNERLKKDHDAMKAKVEYTEARLKGYLGLMDSTEKTKAFLILEDNKEISLREIARSLGVSPATVSKWVDDFVQLGIARLVDGTTLVLAIGKDEASE